MLIALPFVPAGLANHARRERAAAIMLGMGHGVVSLEYFRVTMPVLAQAMTSYFTSDRGVDDFSYSPVVDRTNLAGEFDVPLSIQFSDMLDEGATPIEYYGPSLRKLGLDLEKSAGSVEMLIVDHADAIPTEN